MNYVLDFKSSFWYSVERIFLFISRLVSQCPRSLYCHFLQNKVRIAWNNIRKKEYIFKVQPKNGENFTFRLSISIRYKKSWKWKIVLYFLFIKLSNDLENSLELFHHEILFSYSSCMREYLYIYRKKSLRKMNFGNKENTRKGKSRASCLQMMKV